MTTREIIEQLRVIDVMRNAVDEETGEYLYTEDQIAKEENSINATKEQKLNAIQDYRLSLDDEIKRFQEKKAKQDANIKRTKNHQEYLKELQMDLLGGDGLKTDEYTFFFKESEKVEVSDINLIEDKYCKFEKKPVLKLIKEQIEMADRRKESFFGASIVKNKSLSVR